MILLRYIRIRRNIQLVYLLDITQKVTLTESSVQLVSLTVAVDPLVLHTMTDGQIEVAMTYPQTRTYLFEFFKHPQRVFGLMCMIVSRYSTSKDIHFVLNKTYFSDDDIRGVCAAPAYGRTHLSQVARENNYVFASHPKVYVIRKRNT